MLNCTGRPTHVLCSSPPRCGKLWPDHQAHQGAKSTAPVPHIKTHLLITSNMSCAALLCTSSCQKAEIDPTRPAAVPTCLQSCFPRQPQPFCLTARMLNCKAEAGHAPALLQTSLLWKALS